MQTEKEKIEDVMISLKCGYKSNMEHHKKWMNIFKEKLKELDKIEVK